MSNGKRFAEPEEKESNVNIKGITKYILLVILLVIISCGVILCVRNLKSAEPTNAEILKKAMPEEIDGYKVLGRIKIDSLNVERYILDSKEEKALKNYVCKLYGPNMNEKGNFCIMGHNEVNIFKGLDTLEKGEKIILIDTNEKSVEYEVYDSYIVEPTDLNCLMQGEANQDITLITCETGALTRRIVKARVIEENKQDEEQKSANNEQLKNENTVENN